MFPDYILTALDPFNKILPIVIDVIIKSDKNQQGIEELFTSNVNVLAGFLSSATLIITTILGGILWLKKQVTQENIRIREETKTALKIADDNTVKRIEENKNLVQSVNTSLCDQIKYTGINISEKLIDQKEVIEDIKNTIEKIDEKLDKNTDSVTRNSSRIESHEMRLGNLEDSVYARYRHKDIETNDNIKFKK